MPKPRKLEPDYRPCNTCGGPVFDAHFPEHRYDVPCCSKVCLDRVWDKYGFDSTVESMLSGKAWIDHAEMLLKQAERSYMKIDYTLTSVPPAKLQEKLTQIRSVLTIARQALEPLAEKLAAERDARYKKVQEVAA